MVGGGKITGARRVVYNADENMREFTRHAFISDEQTQ